MENMLAVCDIMARYRCSRQTASMRMKQMRHMEKPLLVPESAVMEWEESRMRYPVQQPERRKAVNKTAFTMPRR